VSADAATVASYIEGGGVPYTICSHVVPVRRGKIDITRAYIKGWMAEKEEALAKREEKRCREKKATCASFVNLTKRAIEVIERNTKAKAMEAEAKLLAEERDHVCQHDQQDAGTKGLGGEATHHHPTTRGVVAHEVGPMVNYVCVCINVQKIGRYAD
jgi:ATPase subunit of ABC transporter with duplicated ATPase domains